MLSCWTSAAVKILVYLTIADVIVPVPSSERFTLEGHFVSVDSLKLTYIA